MRNKLASLVLVVAIVFALCGTSFASTSANSNSKPDGPEWQPHSNSAATEPTNEELRTNMLQLISDAKAGKVAPAERPQIQPAKSNNLSKGTKIAIGVGIAVAVIAVIVIATADRDPGPISVF